MDQSTQSQHESSQSQLCHQQQKWDSRANHEGILSSQTNTNASDSNAIADSSCQATLPGGAMMESTATPRELNSCHALNRQNASPAEAQYAQYQASFAAAGIEQSCSQQDKVSMVKQTQLGQSAGAREEIGSAQQSLILQQNYQQSNDPHKRQLPFSLENCFLMEQTRLIIRLDGVTSHEVDSIVECRGPQQKGREQQFKLEMCCHCCEGRRIQLSSTKLLQVANEPLRELAVQTLEMHCEGLEISGCHTVADHAFGGFQDDFDMDGEDEAEQTGEAQLNSSQAQHMFQQTNANHVHQPRMLPSKDTNAPSDQYGARQQHFQLHQEIVAGSGLLIDTSDARDPMRLKRTSLQMSQNENFYGMNPHELKDHDYEDEEFNMNEQSEEGTAVDYDSQAEQTMDQHFQHRQKQLLTSKSGQFSAQSAQHSLQLQGTPQSNSGFVVPSPGLPGQYHQLQHQQQATTLIKRRSHGEFDDLIGANNGTKRRRLADNGSQFLGSQNGELQRNFSSQLEFNALASPQLELGGMQASNRAGFQLSVTTPFSPAMQTMELTIDHHPESQSSFLGNNQNAH